MRLSLKATNRFIKHNIGLCKDFDYLNGKDKEKKVLKIMNEIAWSHYLPIHKQRMAEIQPNGFWTERVVWDKDWIEDDVLDTIYFYENDDNFKKNVREDE